MAEGNYNNEFLDTVALQDVYKELMDQVNVFNDINKSCDDLFDENMLSSGNAGLTGEPASIAIKSWNNNMNGMDELDNKLRKYVDSIKSVVNKNVEMDSDISDKFNNINEHI